MNGVVKRILLAVLLCLPMAVYSGMSLRHDILRNVVVKSDTLPGTIGNWKGVELPLTEAELSMLDAPASCQRIYTDPGGNRVQVLVLQVNDSQNAHDPKLCMAGSGYKNPVDESVPAPWARPGQDTKVSKAIFTKNNENVTMYYWLQTSAGNITDMSGGFKVAAIFKALTGSSLHGIAVRVIGLENDSGSVTDPKVAAQLWSAISQQVDFDKLVAQLK